jgi:hypothetical protein
MALNVPRGCLIVTAFSILTLTTRYSGAEVFLDLGGEPILGTVIYYNRHKPVFQSCSGVLHKLEGGSLKQTGLTCSDLGLTPAKPPIVLPRDVPMPEQSKPGKYPRPPGCTYCEELPRLEEPSIPDERVRVGPTSREARPFE